MLQEAKASALHDGGVLSTKPSKNQNFSEEPSISGLENNLYPLKLHRKIKINPAPL